jgi:chaperonin GroEL (HSP60 family)
VAGLLFCAAQGARDSKLNNQDQRTGVDIVRRAVQAPARQIVQNAGEDGSLVVGKLLENASYNWASMPRATNTKTWLELVLSIR